MSQAQWPKVEEVKRPREVKSQRKEEPEIKGKEGFDAPARKVRPSSRAHV